MSTDVPHDRAAAAWPYRRITAGQCERLHEAAVTILQRTGVRLELPRAVELLRGADCAVDGDGIVHIPATLVDWALERVPRSFTIYDRDGEPAMVLDGTRTYYGPGSDCLNILDHRSGERRAPTMADVGEGVGLADALADVDYVMSMFLPADVDNRIADRHQMRLMLTRTRKPIVFVTYDASGCYDAVAMAEIVAGGADALAARPFLACYVNAATGLLHNADALEKLIFLAERGVPVLYIPGSQAGVTGPATPAGTIAMFWAGVLTGLVISQLVREGAPFVAKGWGGGGLDMKTMVYGYASPDQRATAIALARHVGLPSFSLAGASDAKTVDQQAVAEAASQPRRRVAFRTRHRARPRLPRIGSHGLAGPACDLRRDRGLAAPPQGTPRHERRGPGSRPHRRGRTRRSVPGEEPHREALPRALLPDALRARHTRGVDRRRRH